MLQEDERKKTNAIIVEQSPHTQAPPPSPVPDTETEDRHAHLGELTRQRSSLRTIADCITLKWQDVSYSVEEKTGWRTKTTKKLLSSVSGVAKPGQLVGIMGPSGAGKSTLLDALAGRIRDSSLTGRITTNGECLRSNMRRRITGYVMQDDALLPMMTTYETLKFAAILRLGRKVPSGAREERVRQTLLDLGLARQSSTKVGSENKRGLSGGEQRRLSIAADIIHEPMLLFLDEPTSGLDSTAALNVVNLLHKLAHEGERTVVLTIHQPSHRVLALFDSLYILNSGSVVYSGPPSSIPLFLQRHLDRDVPVHATYAEAFLDIAAELRTTETGLQTLKDAHATWSSDFPTDDPSMTYTETKVPEKPRANNLFGEVVTIAHRNFLNTLRSKALTAGRIAFITIASAALGSVFFNPDDDFQGAEQRLAFLAIGVSFLCFTALEVMPVFVQEKRVFLREALTGAYGPLSYAIANVALHIPVSLVSAIIHTLVIWWMTGLATDENIAAALFYHILIVFQTLLVGYSVAMFVSVAVPGEITAMALGTGLTAFMFCFSGYFITRTELPAYWVWFHYLSTFKYGFEGLSVNHFKNSNKVYSCPSDLAPPGCQITGDDILDSRDMGNWNKWVSVPCLFGLMVMWRVLFFLVLSWHKRNAFRK